MSKVEAETSKVLMSDSLKGLLPDELDDEAAEKMERLTVTVVAAVQIGEKKTVIPGILRSVLFEVEPELEFRVQLHEAISFVSANQLNFLGFELHHGTDIVKSPGPFLIKGVRIDDIDAVNQMCTLSLGLKRPPKA